MLDKVEKKFLIKETDSELISSSEDYKIHFESLKPVTPKSFKNPVAARGISYGQSFIQHLASASVCSLL